MSECVSEELYVSYQADGDGLWIYLCMSVRKNENQLVYKGQDKSHGLWFHTYMETGEP